jgi:phosphoribosylaminoimidazole (AIR) synthetase
MGIGFVALVRADAVDAAMRCLTELQVEHAVLGEVRPAAERGVEFVD